jgi:lysophospholipase L1-like esterase
VLPLGDSITFGTPTNKGGYRIELFTKAMADGKKMTFVGSQSDGPSMIMGVTAPFPKGNEGYPGWTIKQIDDIATTAKALKDSPHIILMHIGTNDMYMTPAGAPDRLDKLIDKITTAMPSSLLVVSTIIPLSSGMAAVATYNAAVPGVVKKKADAGKHVLFVEMNKGFPSNGLGSDGVHPNDATGYVWMGDTWYAAIKQYLH